VQTKHNSRVRWGILVLTIGAICIIAAAVVYADPWGGNSSNENIKWNLTLVGIDHEQKILSYDEIKAMPYYEGRGGFFTTVGVINGPYKVRGVPVIDLCEMVGGMTSSDIVFVSAEDGYSAVFSYDQVTGNIDTYDPKTMTVIPHKELKLVLAYKLDGKPFSNENGKPLRLAAVGTDDFLTEGHYWVKWVNKLEVVRQKTD
jgi:DMSO/TMAO reductase YedYZ molybdopterin-dependent catalytic subunit